MSDLIDRQALLDAMTEYWNGIAEYHTHLDGETAVYVDNKCLVKRMPAIDAVEVVRCKDCEYFSEPNYFSGKCTLRGDFIFTKDFCSYAVERRTDE